MTENRPKFNSEKFIFIDFLVSSLKRVFVCFESAKLSGSIILLETKLPKIE